MFKQNFAGYNLKGSFKKYSLFALSIIIITIVVFNVFMYYLIINYQNYSQQEKLIESMEMLNLILDEKKTQLSGYAITVARFRDLFDLQHDNLLRRRIFDLDSELGIRGIEVYDDGFEHVFKTGSGFILDKNSDLAMSIYQVMQEGYTFSFFSENDLFELQVNAISPIYDEYSIDFSGFIVITDVITKEYLQSIANNIDGIIQFFENSDFDKNKNELFADAKYFQRKGYYISEERVNNMRYLIGYLPVKNFYNKTIGYFTILKPQNNKFNIIYKLMILGFIYTTILLYFTYKVCQFSLFDGPMNT